MSKTVFITGATSGIGKELVLLFISNNFKVIACGRSLDKLLELERTINKKEQLTTLCFDLLAFDRSIVEDLTNGIDSIDILINNAGYLIKKPFPNITSQDLKDVFQVNFFSIYELTQILLPKLTIPNLSNVVNIGSVGGVNNTLKFPELSVYSSSKGALSILSECLAHDLLEYNIKVNCLALGAVKTKMLKEAFPNTTAGNNPQLAAQYIYDFATTNHIVNGQTHLITGDNP